MITTTQNRIARQTAIEPARRSAGTRSSQSDFQSLFSQATPRPAGTASNAAPAGAGGNTASGARPAASAAKAPAGTAQPSATTAAHTAPRPANTTSAPSSATPAAPAAAGRTESQPATAPAQNTASANPFSRESVEDSMNNWLKGVLQRQNEARLEAYRNALEGWKNTNVRNRELGLPETPAPAEPRLAEIASMPAGYWFRVDS